MRLTDAGRAVQHLQRPSASRTASSVSSGGGASSRTDTVRAASTATAPAK